MAIFKPSSRKRTSARPTISEPISLVIDHLSHDGRGIARYQGKALFVEGGLPGEQVKARITKQARNFSEAVTLDVLGNVNEQRIVPPCPVFSRCGGCSLQHMNAAMQLQCKEQAVLSQLQRWSKLEPKTLAPAIKAEDYAYRQRVRLAVKYTRKGELQMGFREANSQRLVDIKACIVLTMGLQALIPSLRQWLSKIKPNVVSHVECLQTPQSCGVVVRHVRALPIEQRQQLSALLQQVQPNIDCWFQSEKVSSLEDDSGYTVEPRMVYRLEQLSGHEICLAFHPQDFIQSNHSINQKMVLQALEWMAPQKDEYLLDLFCGIGNFSLAMAQQAGWLTGVEAVDAMVARAAENAGRNYIENVNFLSQDLSLEKDDLWQHIKADVVNRGYTTVAGILLDPPRAGAKAICQKIGELAPKRIVYVSCDSSTFARDAGILADQGYSLSRLGVMDMFPQTAHIEVMGLFEPEP